MTSEQLFFRAAEIYSHAPKGNAPARKGVLPIGPTTFYNMLRTGKWPEPDSEIGSVRMWSRSLIESTVKKQSVAEDDTAINVETH